MLQKRGGFSFLEAVKNIGALHFVALVLVPSHLRDHGNLSTSDGSQDHLIMTGQPPPKATNPELLFKITLRFLPCFSEQKTTDISCFSTKIDSLPKFFLWNFKMPLGTPPL